MQVILTEEEWLKLKRQNDEDKKTYVKRIDVAIALEEMIKELSSNSQHLYHPITFQPVKEQWARVISKFMERIN